MRITTFMQFAALVGLVAPQAPLSLGRKYTSVQRMDLTRLKAVHDDVLRIQSERRPVSQQAGLQDYRGILHAHAEDSAHTGGTRPELLVDAKKAGVHVILLSDHIRKERDFMLDSWRGLHDGILFIPGAEGEGFLDYPMASIKEKSWKSREEWIQLVRAGGGNIFLSHVEERLDWLTDQLDGLEIYNHHTDVKDEGEFTSWLRGALTDPARCSQILEGLKSYPQEVMAVQQDYLVDIIKKWDQDSRMHRWTGVAANDCHHNQGFRITVADTQSIKIAYISDKQSERVVSVTQAPKIASWLKDAKPGEVIANLDLDPYERSLRYVTTHILARELTEPAIRQALRDGHAYVAHDWMCDPTGFSVSAGNATQGDEVRFLPGMALSAEAPAPGIIRLFRDGGLIETRTDRSLSVDLKVPGVYRIEVWLELDGEQRPWIYANPVYVR